MISKMANAQQAYQSGVQAEQSGDRKKAELSYREALTADPRMTVARFRLGNVLCDMGHTDEALNCYLVARAQRPDVSSVHNNLGTLFKERGEFEKAHENFLEAVQRDPGSAEAQNNLGTVYQWRGDFERAEECFRHVIDQQPEFVGAHINLGNLYGDCGNLNGAIRCFDQAITLQPNSREAKFNRSLAWVRFGELRKGWNAYESRFGHKLEHRNFPQPVWNYPTVPDSLLIYGEQGIGDEVMFASCFPDAMAICPTCFVECEPRLASLFARSFPAANILPRPCDHLLDQPTILPGVAAQIAAGSLPAFFRSAFDEFPRHSGYLTPDARLQAKWVSRFDQLGQSLKIGIAWRGGIESHLKQLRSIPLEQWQSLFCLPEVCFINLQYGDSAEEVREVREASGVTIHDWPDSNPLENLDDFAAKIAALDLVISVDNSTVHLAGGLGIEVWTLLPFSADFRWMTGREDSPWYPSMRLYRQPVPWDWNSVFREVTDGVRRLKLRS